MPLKISKLERSVFAFAGALLLSLGLVSCSDEIAGADSSSGTSSEPAGEFFGETIRLASVPAEESATLESQYENVIAVLEQELGVEVEFQNSVDYVAVIEGQRAGQVDLATLGSFAYVIAKDSGVNLRPLATLTDVEGEVNGYTSRAYKLTSNDEITDLSDATGRQICFVDAASTSGYLVPSSALLEVDVDPEEDVTPVMAGGHDASLLALDSEQCEIAFALDGMNDVLIDSGQLEEGTLEQIWESDMIPPSPLTLSLDSGISDALGAALFETLTTKVNVPTMIELGICESEEDCDLPDNSRWGYIEVDDSHYAPIREICESTQADACQQVG